MIKELISLANKLDQKGLRKEADYLDSIIKKYCQQTPRVEYFKGPSSCYAQVITESDSREYIWITDPDTGELRWQQSSEGIPEGLNPKDSPPKDNSGNTVDSIQPETPPGI